MRAALIVHRVLAGADANLASIRKTLNQAADAGADLILFPEAALTGLTNNDDPAHDLPLGQAIPGPATQALSTDTRRRGIWLAIGLLERDGNRLYDSAVLIAPDGEIKLKYRRIQPQWHGRRADPSVYGQGAGLAKVGTPLGAFAFLICGDLFDDGLIRRARKLRPDWLLVPFARCFEDGAWNQARWDREELPAYAARVKLAGVTALLTNNLADKSMDMGAFGGAMAVTGDGTVIASLPLGRQGMLLVDL